MVASFSEAWIEIVICEGGSSCPWSPPSWRRELKYLATYIHLDVRVASFLEAWIEIGYLFLLRRNWSKSPPSWRRGLKFVRASELEDGVDVASFLEA